jgi:hypothetical protein
MRVDAKIGIVHHRILVDGATVPVRRERGGWYRVEGPTPGRASLVRYSPFRDRIRIETPEASVDIPFRWRGTRFAWRARTYVVRPMLWTRVTIEEGGRTVVRGRTTLHGIRLDHVSPELEPIAKELALGFAFRLMAFWVAASAGAG